LCLLLIPVQTDAVHRGQDDQIIDLCQGRELALKGIVSKRQGHHERHRAADEILTFVERGDLPDQGQRRTSLNGGRYLRYLLPTGTFDVLEVKDHDDGCRKPPWLRRKDLCHYHQVLKAQFGQVPWEP
jgi:hypothetical protein